MFFLNIFVLGLLGPGPARDQSGPRRHPHPSPSIFSNPHTSRIHVRQERRWRLPLDHGVHGGTTLRDRKLGFHGVWRIARCSAREAWYPRRSHMPCAEVFFPSGRTVQGRRTAPMAGPSSTSLTCLVAEALHTVLNLSVYFFGGTK